MDDLERTIAEIEAMSAIFEDNPDEPYSDSFRVISDGNYSRAKCVIEQLHAHESAPPDDEINEFRFEAEARVVGQSGGMTTTLRIALPAGYPSSCSADVTIETSSLKRSHRDTLSHRLKQRAKDLSGSEAILEIMQECRDVMVGIYERTRDGDGVTEDESCEDDGTESPFHRRWIWVHHLTNAERVRSIISEAKIADLGGFVKEGYPGVIAVEGSASRCNDFVSWVKGNKSRPGGYGRNWGHHVRGEALSDERHFPKSFSHFEDDLGKVGKLCTECSVEDEFREFILQIMKRSCARASSVVFLLIRI